MKRFCLFAAAILAVMPASASEEKSFSPEGGYTVEISLENSPYLRLPIYRNAITSLEVVGDYAIGGTSADAGLSPFLFAVSLSRRRLEMVFDLNQAVPGQQSIKSGFGRGPDGSLYAGTMPGSQGGSGHLIQVRVNGNRIDVADLGVPVPSEGIFAVTSNPGAGAVYGISYPTGKFFVFHTEDHKTDIYEQTVATRYARSFSREYGLRPDDYLTRRLVVDRQGRVYGSFPANRIFRFDPAAKRVDVLPDELPDVAGRSPLGRVDSWAIAPDGMLYGGNAGDGQLFRLDPASGRVANLGKPAMMPRMRGIAFARDGKLYGVTGGPPAYNHVFTYDAKRGFDDFGEAYAPMIAPGVNPLPRWRAFRIGTVASSEDGRYLVMGEEESLSQLMVFSIK